MKFYIYKYDTWYSDATLPNDLQLHWRRNLMADTPLLLRRVAFPSVDWKHQLPILLYYLFNFVPTFCEICNKEKCLPSQEPLSEKYVLLRL